LPQQTYTLEVPSDPNALPEVEDFIEDVARKADIPKNHLNNLMISINEATTNGMLHGNKGDVTKKVSISITVNGRTVKIKVKDEGAGFEPSKVPDPTAPENIFRESGRGLYIMRTCMDKMEYNFTPEGTELELELNLDK